MCIRDSTEAGRSDIKVVGGRYGLGSKEFTPTHVKAVFANLDGEMKNHFTAVSYTHLDVYKRQPLRPTAWRR